MSNKLKSDSVLMKNYLNDNVYNHLKLKEKRNKVENIINNNIKDINDVFNSKTFLISMSEKMKNDSVLIKNFLYVNVYNHPKLKEKRNEVENIITKLFDYYLKNFDKLPKDWSIQKKEESENRIICDYISGMTDRYASKLYKSIYE